MHTELLAATASLFEHTPPSVSGVDTPKDRTFYRFEVTGRLHVSVEQPSNVVVHDVDDPISLVGTCEMLHMTPVKIVNVTLNVKPETTSKVAGEDIEMSFVPLVPFITAGLESNANPNKK